jgi:hypothetical protein
MCREGGQYGFLDSTSEGNCRLQRQKLEVEVKIN